MRPANLLEELGQIDSDYKQQHQEILARQPEEMADKAYQTMSDAKNRVPPDAGVRDLNSQTYSMMSSDIKQLRGAAHQFNSFFLKNHIDNEEISDPTDYGNLVLDNSVNMPVLKHISQISQPFEEN